jgi:hypothetical protein
MGQKRLTNNNHQAEWPSFLGKLRQSSAQENEAYIPIVVDMEETPDRLKGLIAENEVSRVVDVYDEQLAELFISKNAHLYKANEEVKTNSITDYLTEHFGSKPSWKHGTWVYYPWSGILLHTLEKGLFLELRTLRNKDLILIEEQDKYSKIRVGCAGMSVGSNGATAIALTGGMHLKIADGAVFTGSNLNRVRVGVESIGINKAIVVARQLFELNPYIDLDLYTTGLNDENVGKFFDNPELDVVIDEIDDLRMKVLLRVEARKRGIPVVMVTEPGNEIILDVERFDLNQKAKLFHGLAGDIDKELLAKDRVNQREFIKYATRIIGPKNLSLRDQQSMLKVGTELPSPPQLGTTAMFAGAVIGYAVRQIALGGKLKSGRTKISLDAELLINAKNLSKRIEHYRHTKEISKAMDSL